MTRLMRLALVSMVVAPLAFVALIAVQALLALRQEHPLPVDPGYRVDGQVVPAGDVDEGSSVRLVLLGDSTVAGVGAPTAEESLGMLVGERVAAASGRTVSVRGYGISGARTGDLVGQQVPELDTSADVVVVVVGSNDATHLTMPWAVRRQTRALVEEIRRRTDAPIVLAGAPLFGSATVLARPLRDVVGWSAALTRRAQREAALELGIRYVEIAELASPRFAGVPEAMSIDGFHPSPVGYGFWADAIAPAVIDALVDPAAAGQAIVTSSDK